MKKDKSLLEEFERFHMLCEYDYYVQPKETLNEEDPEEEGEVEDEMGDENEEDFSDVEPDETEEFEDEEITDVEGEFEEDEIDGEVEIDITDLVNSTEEAKELASTNNEKIDSLLKSFEDLSTHLNKMDDITSKIDSLESEVEKRVPTQDEKLEMRSLSSYPYNMKLNDFWRSAEGYTADERLEKDDEEKEYTLKQDEVENDYNEIEVKDSFDGY